MKDNINVNRWHNCILLIFFKSVLQKKKPFKEVNKNTKPNFSGIDLLNFFSLLFLKCVHHHS
jgi:hypothetical protein